MLKFAKQFLFLMLALVLTSYQVMAQYFWQETNGPFQYGGAIFCFTNTPAGDIFAGTSANLILKSTNNGETWTSFHTELTPCFYSIVITSTGHLFAAGTYTGHIFRSLNNGDSWEVVKEGIGVVFSLVVNSSDHIFATSRGGGIFCSKDDGENWIEMNTGLDDLRVEVLAINNAGNIFAGTRGGGLYRSKDNAESWVAVNNGLTDLRITCISIHPSGYIFAGTRGEGVFRSTDNGENWVSLSQGLSEGLINSIYIENSGVIRACTFNGIFQSNDNGESWIQMNCIGLDNVRVMSFSCNAAGNMFAGTRNGIYRSVDGGNGWTRYEGLTTKCTIWSMTKNDKDHIFAGTSVGNVFRSTDRGENWVNISNGINAPEGIYSVATNSQGFLFAALCGDGVFRSTDGESWERTGQLSGLSRSLIFNETSGYLFAGTTENGYRSSDYGDTWDEILYGVGICCLFINSTGHLFAGDFGGNIFRSMDDGENWEMFSTGGSAKVKSFVENKFGDLFVALPGSGVFRSTDNGENWIAINNGLDNLQTYSVVANASDELFTCVYGIGVYRSSDWGENWEELNDGLTDHNVQFLLIDDAGYIYAGTEFNVFKSVQPTTDIKEIVHEVPVSFRLSQNYPNPFNPVTTITYQLPKDSNVFLRIFNITGEMVKILVEEKQNAGSYKIQWNGRDEKGNSVSGGLYLYQLKVDDFSQSNKMLFIR